MQKINVNKIEQLEKLYNNKTKIVNVKKLNIKDLSKADYYMINLIFGKYYLVNYTFQDVVISIKLSKCNK